MMLPKVWLINMVLAVLVFSIAIQAADFWTQTRKPFLEMTAPKKIELPVQPRITSRKNEPDSAYDLIAEKTLFSKDRIEYVPEVVEPAPVIPKAEPTRQPIFLYGIVMAGDYRKALLKENAGRSDENRWVYEGDRISGMTVTSIEKEKLLLSSGDKTVEVLLYDRKKPRNSPQTAKAGAPTVVTLSSAMGGSSAQKNEGEIQPALKNPKQENSAEESSNPKASPAIEKTSTDQKPAEKASSAPSKVFSSQGFPMADPPGNSTPADNPAADSPGNSTPAGKNSGYQIIKTPFGEIKRKMN